MLASLLLLSSAAWAAGVPSASELLRRALEPAGAFEGRARVETAGSPGTRVQELRVVSAPGGRYRREVLASRGGEPLQVAVSDGRVEWVWDKARAKAWKGAPPEPDYKRLGPEEERALLEENYLVSVAPGEPVARRATWRLELRTKDGGGLRRRLWTDREHGTVLRSESYRPDGAPASSMRFTKAAFPPAVEEGVFRFEPPAGTRVVERAEADYMEQDEAEQAAGYAPRLPARPPAGFVLESLDVFPKGKRRILHARYSDGASALSLFQYPSGLRLELGRGGRPLRVGRSRATLSWTEEGHVLSWSSRGRRFALVGDLPEAELLRVAESVR